LLPSEHGEVMPQDEQLNVFGELAAAVRGQQPQHSREGEANERSMRRCSHRPPSPEARASALVQGGSENGCEARHDLVFARAREPNKWRHL
jgi:hypothetical protein